MILKCKMCGGDIQISPDITIGTCEYCGSTMTIPHIDSDKKARLFNRANSYRLNCEFDKAYEVYKTIADEDDQEPEAYWGMILSEYGIEYVDDPKTGKKIPTCHRANTKSIKSSVNYEYATKYADSEQLFIYKDEAEELDNLRKRILAIADEEEPYDVFICYKESDDITGERTEDSVIAQDIYDALVDKGIRVFFARKSLSDKLGKDFEPYIFGALNSAKVMLMVSTSAEHCQAVWVRNEWERFISFSKDNDSKWLIPVYSGMSPYEFPDEFTKYQAQNMQTIGAMQDLVDGVKKLLSSAEDNDNKKSYSQQDIISLINESKEKEKAEKKEKNKIVGSIALKTGLLVLLVIILSVVGVNLYSYLDRTYIGPSKKYNQAKQCMQDGEYSLALNILEELGNYKDAESLLEECSQLGEEAKYNSAIALIDTNEYLAAKAIFDQMGEYKDAVAYSEICQMYEDMSLAQDGEKSFEMPIIYTACEKYPELINVETVCNRFDFVAEYVSSIEGSSWSNTKRQLSFWKGQIYNENGIVAGNVVFKDNKWWKGNDLLVFQDDAMSCGGYNSKFYKIGERKDDEDAYEVAVEAFNNEEYTYALSLFQSMDETEDTAKYIKACKLIRSMDMTEAGESTIFIRNIYAIMPDITDILPCEILREKYEFFDYYIENLEGTIWKGEAGTLIFDNGKIGDNLNLTYNGGTWTRASTGVGHELIIKDNTITMNIDAGRKIYTYVYYRQ